MENDDKNQKKAKDNIFPVFTLCRFGSLREILIAAEVEEEDYLREGQDERKYIIVVYTHTHIYKSITCG